VLRNGARGETTGQKALSLHEQSFLREVGRQCGDDQKAARGAHRRRIPGRVPRALSRPGGRREGAKLLAHSFTYLLVIIGVRSARPRSAGRTGESCIRRSGGTGAGTRSVPTSPGTN